MALRRYKLYGTASATSNLLDSMQANRAGVVRQVIILTTFDSITDNATLRVQLSRSPVGDFATGSAGNAVLTLALAETAQCGNFVTSGLSQPQSTFIFECNDKLSVGEPLYLNAYIVGTVTYTAAVIVVIDES